MQLEDILHYNRFTLQPVLACRGGSALLFRGRLHRLRTWRHQCAVASRLFRQMPWMFIQSRPPLQWTGSSGAKLGSLTFAMCIQLLAWLLPSRLTLLPLRPAWAWYSQQICAHITANLQNCYLVFGCAVGQCNPLCVIREGLRCFSGQFLIVVFLFVEVPGCICRWACRESGLWRAAEVRDHLS